MRQKAALSCCYQPCRVPFTLPIYLPFGVKIQSLSHTASQLGKQRDWAWLQEPAVGLLGHVCFPVEEASGAGIVPVHVFHAECEHDE